MTKGVSAGGVCLGCLPDTSPPPPSPRTESQIGVKTLPCRNYVADGNKGQLEDLIMAENKASSTLPFFVPFKNGFSAVSWRCLHLTSKRSQVPLT